MVNNKVVKTAAACAVMLFLVFAGMRVALLDRSFRPKPKPRAVLNLCGKKAPSAAHCYETVPVYSLDAEFPSFACCKTVWISTVTSTGFLALHPVDPELLSLHGRSPPSC
uniref:Uncharacterized protein n=1 Tax=Geobacter sp. (strain M21) TaxID=443144 RepID=C6E1T5_GEOSM